MVGQGEKIKVRTGGEIRPPCVTLATAPEREASTVPVGAQIQLLGANLLIVPLMAFAQIAICRQEGEPAPVSSHQVRSLHVKVADSTLADEVSFARVHSLDYALYLRDLSQLLAARI